MRTLIKKFMSSESGATAIEYGLIAGLISVGIATATGEIGGEISDAFKALAEQLGGATLPDPTP